LEPLQIRDFVARLNTTKETVRHYEDLQLLTPIRSNNRREYGEKEVMNFQVIMELKSMGMGLKDIQLLFDLKRAFGCGDKMLVREVIVRLTDHLEALRQEEVVLRQRRIKLEQELEQVKRIVV
jgi:DNA-binding transcriptional MerR regulator